ncbi:MAG: tRNA (adenosine(37)-N6)-threonylcarbamoyltransferase complex ATPase subunit type 1 TsaE [Bauldia sp.]|nr:tRNA (adenosine(37)-N6)-threonylcarbamoyltransferase complex ATPase subunit type 1 TsaE [Bauldia sp.]
MSEPATITLDLPDESATARLGAALARRLRPGDAVLLSGDLGAGKTSLARAILRAAANDPALEVPSPTFTLVQAYELPVLTISHFDLYRLADPAELREIGFDDALGLGAVLVEWPERAPAGMPREALAIRLSLAGQGRRAELAGSPGWLDRLHGLPQEARG